MKSPQMCWSFQLGIYVIIEKCKVQFMYRSMKWKKIGIAHHFCLDGGNIKCHMQMDI